MFSSMTCWRYAPVYKNLTSRLALAAASRASHLSRFQSQHTAAHPNPVASPVSRVLARVWSVLVVEPSRPARERWRGRGGHAKIHPQGRPVRPALQRSQRRRLEVDQVATSWRGCASMVEKSLEEVRDVRSEARIRRSEHVSSRAARVHACGTRAVSGARKSVATARLAPRDVEST